MSRPAAVIGVGRRGAPTDAKGGGHQIGYHHSRHLRQHPSLELVAGADIDAANLAAWQRAFGIPTGFYDYRQMLAEVRPEFVSICTYVGLHREIIAGCADAGVRGILCEKPFLATPAELAAVRRIAAETGVKIAVAHIRRYHPVFRRLRELVVGGEIGVPLLCFAGLPGWDLSEQGSHHLDLFRYVNDGAAATWVMGQARVRGERGYGHAMEEHAIAYVAFDNGCKALLDGGQDLAAPYYMVIVGSEGELRVGADYRLQVSVAGGRRVESYPTDSEGHEQMWRASLDGLLAWVDGGAEPPIAMESALRSCELSLAAYVSSVRRDRVDLPLTDDSIDRWPLELLAPPP